MTQNSNEETAYERTEKARCRNTRPIKTNCKEGSGVGDVYPLICCGTNPLRVVFIQFHRSLKIAMATHTKSRATA